MTLLICANPVFDFGNCSSGPLQIRFVDHDRIRRVDHGDFLQLKAASVIRRHNQDRIINGERFNSESLTAAHPNLPFGSWVRIVNSRNGKFEVVRINDRGPYQEGREIDVSYRVARKIGLIHSGVTQVRLELIQLPTRHTRSDESPN